MSIFNKKKGLSQEKIQELSTMIKQNDELRDAAFWTIDLLQWISSTNDALLLSQTSHRLNCFIWPEYLPSRPKWYDNKNMDDSLQTSKISALIKVLSEKSEALSPGLDRIIWLSQAY